MVPSTIFLFLFLYLVSSISSLFDSVPLLLFNGVPVEEEEDSNQFQRITLLASTALARARHLKSNGDVSVTPISPFAGAYSVTFGVGTPPQLVSMVMDTGSSLSWLPCTKRYVCRNCSVSSAFIPRQSSSARILGCLNPKCSWIHKSFDSRSSCPGCHLPEKNCTEICPPYLILYGSGSTGGVTMVETLTISNKSVVNFLVGCSIFAANLPAGIAGFGRGNASIPSQLGLKKFSYCLVPHKLDKDPASSLLSMDSESNSDQKTKNLSYTLLLKNPIVPEKASLSEYYYVGLRTLTVGGKKVEVSYKEMSPDSNGNGGTIVDSGSTLTYMTSAILDSVTESFVKQVKDHRRAPDMESATGLRPCFEVNPQNAIKLPELKLNFKGGAKMTLPLENYFIGVRDGSREAVCLAVVTDGTQLGPETTSGPAIILGNLFMHNYFVEFDLRNERFGFRQQFCS